MVTLLGSVFVSRVCASTAVFFDNSQVAVPVSSDVTSDTVRSNGYLFTYTRDKLFTGGTGHIIGRPVRVEWPEGVEAQAVTAGPIPGKAKITLERADGDVFELTAFTAKLLANTAGAGGTIEIVPFLNGEEVFNDPFYFDATGNYGNTFSYDTSPNPWGSTAPLTGFDKYTIDLYVDFALTVLTLNNATMLVPGDFDGDGDVDGADFVVWQTHFPTSTGATLADGDADSDGDVDGADFVAWQTSFPFTPGPGASQVPEPATWFILLFAMGGMVLCVRRDPVHARETWVGGLLFFIPFV